MINAMLAERLVIENQLPELRRMAQWLQDSAAASGVAEDDIFRLDVCANEAVANIISYAFNDPLRHDIILEMHKTTAGVRLDIRDDGKPFNLLEAAEHQAPVELGEAKIGGLGIHLIRRLMPGCQYRHVDGFNVLSLDV
ncbi:MAG: ATP-binding protein [Burkholderiales bacterium]